MSHPRYNRRGCRRVRHCLTKPKAYIVLKSGYEPSEKLAKEIQTYVKNSIASYKAMMD